MSALKKNRKLQLVTKSTLVGTALSLAAVTLGYEAAAVGARTFLLDSQEKLSGGDLKGVAVGSDGVVRSGFNAGSIPIPDATSAMAALPLDDGSLLVGTGPSGKIYRVEGERVTVFADTGELAVTSLALGPRGAVYAATIPNGRIYRVSQGKAEAFVTLAEGDNVWALAFDAKKESLFAATGPAGRLFRIGVDGKASIYFDSDEPHLVSLAVDPGNGDVLAGSSGKGILYRVAGPGKATVVHDFPADEIRAVAAGKTGDFFAIANEYSEPPEVPKKGVASKGQAGPQSATPRPKPGKGAVYHVDRQGRVDRVMKNDDMHYMSLAVDAKGDAFVGTGVDGRLYSVNDVHVSQLVADVDERQVGALVAAGKPDFVGGYFVGSDPVADHRITGRGGVDAVWTSKPLDAGLRARFGRIGWRSTGALEMSTRSGNTATVDSTWSAWSEPVTAGSSVPSPRARYLQIRARWSRDATATLSGIEVAFVTDNLRALVTEISASQKGASRESKEGIVASGAEAPKHDSTVKLSWKVDNPDSDSLRYRLFFAKEGQSAWRGILADDEVLTKAEYDWDTQSLPEGRYVIRVEASDEPANPLSEVEKHARDSAPFVVDNTPPAIRELTVVGRRLKARIVDGASPVVRVDVALDGKPEWKTLPPSDGVFDGSDETTEVELAALGQPGPHIVVVRAFDAAGNSVTRDLETR